MSEPIKSITGIILAAGRGDRMGRTKQLLPFRGTTVLGRVVEAATGSGLDRVIVVLGHHARQIQKKIDFSETRIVINQNYLDGQATSLRAGLSEISWECSAAMFLLADQPLMGPKIINTMIDAWQTSELPILIPYCNGNRGNPVIIGSCLFPELLQIKGDYGARALFKEYPEQIERITINNTAILTDVDTPADYDRLLQRWDKVI